MKVMVWKDTRYRRKDKWTVTVKRGATVTHARFRTREDARAFRRTLKRVMA